MTAAAVLQRASQMVVAPQALRRRYIEAAAQTAQESHAPHVVAVGWEDAVSLIEIFSLSAVTAEIVHELGIATASDAKARAREVVERLRVMAHVDLDETSRKAEQLIGMEGASEPGPLPMPWDHVLRTFTAIAAEFPIEAITRAADEAGRPELAHRARISHEVLRGFVRRNDPAQANRLRVAGHAYAMGRLSLSEVAVVLDISESDAVFELEQAGYSRSIETIQRLARDATGDLVSRVAAGIAERGKLAPPVDPEHVRRDVVASQRIEGIDARRWV